MPLYKGKKNIGRNVSELVKSGHEYSQAVAIALQKADEKPKKRTKAKKPKAKI